MPRHRRTDSSDSGLRRFGLRATAIATLVAGVAGGLYLGDRPESRDSALDWTAIRQAELTEQMSLQDHALQRILADRRKAAEQEQRSRERSQAAEQLSRNRTGVTVGPTPESCQEFTGNRAIGCTLMLEEGYAIDQFPCLNQLWTKESGWNHKSYNSSSGAYGIPQALPGNKMAAYGDDWETNPATQIKWGLNYIRNRYSTPCGAWSAFQSQGWY